MSSCPRFIDIKLTLKSQNDDPEKVGIDRKIFDPIDDSYSSALYSEETRVHLSILNGQPLARRMGCMLIW